MSQRAWMIAGGIVAAILVLGGLIVVLGDDSGNDVNARDQAQSTSALSTPTMPPATTTTAPAPATTAPTTAPPTTAAPAVGENPTPATAGEAGTDAASPASGNPPTTIDSLADIKIAPWQFDVPVEEVRARFEKVGESGDLCVPLVALSSTPEFNVFPDLSAAQFDEYFANWFATADQIRPRLSDELANQMDAARKVIEFIQKTIADDGGTVNAQAARILLDARPTELPKVLPFYVAVAAQCPNPTS